MGAKTYFGNFGKKILFSLIQVKSREEAMEWARCFPNPTGRGKPARIEVRQLYELEDFPPGEAGERFRE